MYPTLFKIFGITIHSYGAMLVIAFFAAVWLGRKRAPRFGFTPPKVYDACFWALILGVIGARVFFIAQEWPYYSSHPRELWSIQFQGLTSFGGVAFGILGIFIWTRQAKKSFVRFLDLIAAPFLLAHAIGRIGCLLNGCCYGGHCDLPWGIHVQGLPGTFHPAQVYDSLMNLAALGLLLLIEKRGTPYGRSMALAMILHGASRFIYEFFRAGTTSTTVAGSSFLTEGHIAAAVLMAIGVVCLLYLPRRALIRQEVAPA